MDLIDRKLRNIGRESSERHYDVCESYGAGQCNRVDVMVALVRRGSSNEAGAAWSLDAEKANFTAGMRDEAPRKARARRVGYLIR